MNRLAPEDRPHGPDALASGPLLERLGLRYFARLSRLHAVAQSSDAVHTLTSAEHAELRGIERAVLFKAATAGALSACGSAVLEIGLAPVYRTESGGLDWRYWVWIGTATVIVSAVEIAYLYWMSLNAVHALSRAAGLELFPKQGREEGARAVAAALARAALELPNPKDAVAGFDPLREAPRWRLVLASVFYKIKIGLTNFLVKALVRRVLGRAALRGYVPLVAVPVTAVWDMLVCRWVVREARVRVMGPSAVQEYGRELLAKVPELSDTGREAIFDAVACVAICTRDLHPNLAAFFEFLQANLGKPSGDLGNRPAFLNRMTSLSDQERAAVLGAMELSCVLDGRLLKQERELWIAAARACGQRADESRLKALLRAFLNGERFPQG
ncbi:MAG: hypothetical protein AMXMBFR7_38250 [Planctomycetota bacterium]